MMTRSTAWRLSALGLGAALAIIAVWLTSSLASAGGASVAVGSGSTGVGFETKIAVEALNVNEPGLGAWTFDVTYDGAVVTPAGCQAAFGGICNTSYAENVVRLVGVSTFGRPGSNELASITFSCDQPGTSVVDVDLVVFADATLGSPQPVNATVQAGAITCTAGGAPSPTATPTTGPGAEPLDGDVNCDGLVNSVDSALILQYTAGFIDTLPCPENGDINGDGRIDAVDATLILQIVAGFI